MKIKYEIGDCGECATVCPFEKVSANPAIWPVHVGSCACREDCKYYGGEPEPNVVECKRKARKK